MVVWKYNFLLQVCFEGVLFILKIRYLQPEFYELGVYELEIFCQLIESSNP
jgi:hypothetical protein